MSETYVIISNAAQANDVKGRTGYFTELQIAGYISTHGQLAMRIDNYGVTMVAVVDMGKYFFCENKYNFMCYKEWKRREELAKKAMIEQLKEATAKRAKELANKAKAKRAKYLAKKANEKFWRHYV